MIAGVIVALVLSTQALPATITLRLFEKLAPQRLVISAVADGTLRLDGRPAGARIEIEYSAGILRVNNAEASAASIDASNALLRLDPGGGYGRTIDGAVALAVAGRQLQVVATMPLEQYVAAVVEAEMSPAPAAALQAQAVVTRTFAAVERGTGRHAGYDFCDLTHCQVYKGAASQAARDAAATTAGTVLVSAEGQLAHVAFFSTCGGATTSARSVWGGTADSDLDGVDDLDQTGQPYCKASPHLRWRLDIAADKLADLLGKHLHTTLAPDFELKPRPTPSGWVTRVELGQQRSLSGEEFHLLLGREMGWSRFKSGRFVVTRQGDRFIFEGLGLGHGVGMCQYGARALAEAGKSSTEILAHYFPRLRATTVK
jgi:stage II sporulation protein D